MQLHKKALKTLTFQRFYCIMTYLLAPNKRSKKGEKMVCTILYYVNKMRVFAKNQEVWTFGKRVDLLT